MDFKILIITFTSELRQNVTNFKFNYFSVNCWPSDNGQGGCDVNIEYELEQDQLELHDVVISIPIAYVGYKFNYSVEAV